MKLNTQLKSTISVIALMAAMPAFAADENQTKRMDIKIEAQSLDRALSYMGQQFGVQIAIFSDDVPRLNAIPLEGVYTEEEALKLMLKGSGLSYKRISDTMIAVGSPDRLASGDLKPGFQRIAYNSDAYYEANMAVLDEDENRDDMEGSEFEEIVVFGNNFHYNLVESANKMPLSIKDTPQSVKIITRDMLDFASITSINDIYKLDAGGYASNGRSGAGWLYFRGFENGWDNAFKVDGFRITAVTSPDLAPYERLEVVKGAVSTLYGQSSPAGTLNAITKKPQAEFGGSVSFEAGQWDHYRAEVDIYGSLTEDEKLTFRFVGAYLNEGGDLIHNHRENVVLAPSLKYDFSEDTSLLVQVNYQKLDFNISSGFPATLDENGPGGVENYQIVDVPYSRYGVGTDWSNTKRDLFFVRANLDHHFANDWTLRTNLQYTNNSGSMSYVWLGVYNTISPDPEGTQDVYLYFSPENSNPSYTAEVNLFGDVEMFGRNHTLFFGADYSLTQFKQRRANGTLRGSDTGFNIFDPDFSLIPEPSGFTDFASDGLFMPEDVGRVRRLHRREKALGITAQALLRPTDQLTVSVGARYTRNTSSAKDVCCSYEGFFNDPFDTFVDEIVPQSALVFQGGVTYALTEDINVYATYGQTFQPGGDFAYDPSDPEGVGIFLGSQEGETYEAGLKGELFDQQFFWSLAFFYTAKINLTQRDPEHTSYSIEVGKQRSKGIELDFQGEIMPGWDVYLSAVVMNNEYTEGELAGVVAPFGPKFGLSVFTSYEIQEGTLQGLGFGGGIVHKNRPVFEDGGSSFPHLFKDYTEVDLRVFYNAEPWRFEVSATNIFDARYFSPVFVWLGGQIAINPPRRVLAKVTRQF